MQQSPTHETPPGFVPYTGWRLHPFPQSWSRRDQPCSFTGLLHSLGSSILQTHGVSQGPQPLPAQSHLFN